MAGAKRSWTRPLAVAVLCGFLSMGWARLRRKPDGALTGKLTDLHSAPLEGVTVVVRNEATGAEARATTARNGTYRFTGLDSGEYTLEAESPQLGRGQVEGIFVPAGHEARVQTAMEFELPPAEPVLVASHPLPPVTPVQPAAIPAKPHSRCRQTRRTLGNRRG